jgi:hypothetical protein
MRYGVIHRQVRFLPLHSIKKGVKCVATFSNQLDLQYALTVAVTPTKQIGKSRTDYIGNGLQMERQIGTSVHREERFGDGGVFR